MTKNEARIVILEDALLQAQHTVNFLHSCLINPSNGEMNGGYSYKYPEGTIKKLDEWNKLVPLQEYFCVHSGFNDDCVSCKKLGKRIEIMYEAKITLGLIVKNDKD